MSSGSDLESGCSYNSGTTFFPEVVKFMRSDEDNDLVVFRRFKKLNFYNLLYKQYRLIQLENEVTKIEGKNRPEELLAPILKAGKWLDDYNRALVSFAEVLKLSKPPAHITNLLLDQVRSHTLGELQHFVRDETLSDLVSFPSEAKGRIHTLIDRTWLKRFFLKTKSPHSVPGVRLYSESHVRMVEKVILNVCFCLLVLVPVWILSHLASITAKLIVIVAAITLAAIIVAGLLGGPHGHTLALLLGYTAILVVFLSNTI